MFKQRQREGVMKRLRRMHKWDKRPHHTRVLLAMSHPCEPQSTTAVPSGIAWQLSCTSTQCNYENSNHSVRSCKSDKQMTNEQWFLLLWDCLCIVVINFSTFTYYSPLYFPSHKVIYENEISIIRDSLGNNGSVLAFSCMKFVRKSVMTIFCSNLRSNFQQCLSKLPTLLTEFLFLVMRFFGMFIAN